MIIGVDPGFTGAIAFLKRDSLIIKDLPVKLFNNKKQIDEKLFVGIIKKYGKGAKFAVIEDIGARPGQGIVSTSRFTYNAGILLGVIASHDIEVLKVPPSVWKPALGLSSNKKLSIALAKKLFPSYKEYFRLVKHDGRAEALLIAHYARMLLDK